MTVLRWIVAILALTLSFGALTHSAWAENSDRIIRKIGFHGVAGLDPHDLIAPLPIQVGSVYDPSAVDAAVEALTRRGIFKQIQSNVFDVEGGVEVRFEVTPVLFVFEVVVLGSKSLTEEQVRRFAGLRLGEPLDPTVLEPARQRILEGYHREGHFKPAVKVDVRNRSDATQQVVVEFLIWEGEQAGIEKVVLLGGLPADVKELPERLKERAKGLPASAKSRKELRQELLAALRKEGYLQASIDDGEYLVESEDKSDRTLQFRINTRSPISLIFEGNTQFSTEELLAPLKIETRSVPFTPQAVRTLCRKISVMYQERGFLFARADVEELARTGARRRYLIRVVEGVQVYLRRIVFSGNNAFSTTQLRKVMETTPRGDWWSRLWTPGFIINEVLSADLAAIDALYQRSGYRATAVTFELSPSLDSPAIDLAISIEEGKQSLIETVEMEWQGAVPLRDDQLQVLTEIVPAVKVGAPFNTEVLRAEENRLNEELISRGFVTGSVNLVADPEEGKVVYQVVQGPQVRVGKIWLEGNVLSRDAVILRALQFAPDELISVRKLRASEDALYQLGFFKSVSIEPLDGSYDSAVEDLVVRVYERDSGTIDFGGSFNTEDGLHLSTELNQRNLEGSGNGVLLGIDGYFKTGSRIFDSGTARALFSHPYLFSTNADLFVEGFAQYSLELVKPYSHDKVGTSVGVNYPFSERVEGAVSVVAFREALLDVPEDVQIGEFDSGNTFYSELHSQLEWDQRDNAFNPREGYRSSVQARLSSEALLSEANFVGVSMQHSVYVPLSQQLVWANAFRGDYLEPFGDTDVIPLSARVFLGGRNSLRGFSRHVVGPRGELLHIIGGDRAVNVSSEMQYDLAGNLVGVLFLDVGQAFLSNRGSFEGSGLGFQDLRFSPGIGLRYRTPIGPLSMEYGFALDREFGERFGRFVLSIGAPF